MSERDVFHSNGKAARLRGVVRDRKLRLARMQMLIPAMRKYKAITRQEAAAILGASVCTATRYLSVAKDAGVAYGVAGSSRQAHTMYYLTDNQEAEDEMFATLRKSVEDAENGCIHDIAVRNTDEEDAKLDKKFAQKVIRAKAKQIGVARDALVRALFGDGPAHGEVAA